MPSVLLRGLVAGALCSMLLGCVSPPAQPPSPRQNDWLRRLADSQQAGEAARGERLSVLRTRVATVPALEHRLELAALLAGPAGSAAERNEARTLLGTCAPPLGGVDEHGAVAACRTLAALLDALATSDARLAAAQSEQASQALRIIELDGQLAAATSSATARQEQDARKLSQLERRIAEQQRQNRQLRRQIRDLQDIENSIEDRHEDETRP